MNRLCKPSVDQIKRLRSHHAIILALNDTGRTNLYRLVSMSHLKYFSVGKSSRPCIPKSEYHQTPGRTYSSVPPARPESCYEAVREKRPEKEIIRLVNFYDYLEIQPLGNNRFMIGNEKLGVRDEKDLH